MSAASVPYHHKEALVEAEVGVVREMPPAVVYRNPCSADGRTLN